MPLDLWQGTRNTGVQSEVKLQEAGQHEAMGKERWQSWCSYSFQSRSVRECSLLPWAWKFILPFLSPCYFSLIVPQKLGYLF